jgi:hypothetical protein
LSLGTAFADYFALYHDSANTVNGFYSQGSGPTSWNNISTTPTIAISTWYHVAAIFTSATASSLYINGGNKINSTGHAGVTPAAIVTPAISFNQGGGLGEFSGTIAFPCVWNIALLDADVLELANGCPPRKKYPGNLIYYPQLNAVNSPEPDMCHGAWTVTGAQTVADNPRTLVAP